MKDCGYCYIHSFGKFKGIPFWKNSTVHFIVTIILATLFFLSGPSRKNQEKILQKQDEISEKLKPRTEAKPHLSIELAPGPREFLKKDGNSQLYFGSLYNNIFLILPFKIRNIDQIHAVKISAEYSSPAQHNVPIELGEKSSFLALGEEIPETFRPHINISTVINNDDIEEFNVKIVIKYRNYDNKDAHVYNTTLELLLVKEKTNENTTIYKIKNHNLIFDEK